KIVAFEAPGEQRAVLHRVCHRDVIALAGVTPALLDVLDDERRELLAMVLILVFERPRRLEIDDDGMIVERVLEVAAENELADVRTFSGKRRRGELEVLMHRGLALVPARLA